MFEHFKWISFGVQQACLVRHSIVRLQRATIPSHLTTRRRQNRSPGCLCGGVIVGLALLPTIANSLLKWTIQMYEARLDNGSV